MRLTERQAARVTALGKWGTWFVVGVGTPTVIVVVVVLTLWLTGYVP